MICAAAARDSGVPTPVWLPTVGSVSLQPSALVQPENQWNQALNRPLEGRPFEGKPLEGRPFEGKPLEGRPFEGRPFDGIRTFEFVSKSGARSSPPMSEGSLQPIAVENRRAMGSNGGAHPRSRILLSRVK